MKPKKRKDFGISFLIAVIIHAILFIAIPKFAPVKAPDYVTTPEKEIVETSMVKLMIKKNNPPKIKKDIKQTKVVEKKKGTSDKRTLPIKALPKIEISNKTIEIKDITPKVSAPKEIVRPDINNTKITIPDIVPKIDQKRLQKEKFEIREDVLQIRDVEKKNTKKDFKDEYPMPNDKNGINDEKLSINVDKETDGDINAKSEAPKGIEILSVNDGKGSAVWLVYTKPKYPPKAEAEQWEGTVVLMLTVDSSGKVNEVSVKQKSGFTILDSAAAKEAYNWKISVKENGMKKKGKVVVAILFKF